jgi:hypothetical protein
MTDDNARCKLCGGTGWETIAANAPSMPCRNGCPTTSFGRGKPAHAAEAKCRFCAGTGMRDEGDRAPHWVECRYCKGSGRCDARDPRPYCIRCGNRWVPREGEDATVAWCVDCVLAGPPVEAAAKCLDCNGAGGIFRGTSTGYVHCRACGGTGKRDAADASEGGEREDMFEAKLRFTQQKLMLEKIDELEAALATARAECGRLRRELDLIAANDGLACANVGEHARLGDLEARAKILTDENARLAAEVERWRNHAESLLYMPCFGGCTEARPCSVCAAKADIRADLRRAAEALDLKRG